MEWKEMPELKGLIKQLKKAFPEKLSHIDSERILFANFSRKKSKNAAKVGGIPKRFSIFLKDFVYFIEVHKESWEEFDEGMKFYVVFHELMHIPAKGFDIEERQFGKVLDHDLKDFKVLIKEYGVDQENTEKLLRHIKSKN